jgi:site-specific recombinase XerD
MNYPTTSFTAYLQTQYRYKPQTIAQKEKQIQNWQKLCGKAQKLADLNTTEVLKIIQIQKNNYTCQVLNSHIQTLEQYYYYLIQTGRIKTHPIKNFRLKTEKPKLITCFLTEKELLKIYENFPKTGHYGGQFDYYAQRNKVMLGLLIFQGLESGTLKVLEISHIDLEKGIIQVPSVSESKLNSRKLPLESIQIIPLQYYINHTRNQIINLVKAPENTTKLFPQSTQNKASSITMSILKRIQKDFKISSLKQIRNSRIALWLKQYNIREVQYKSGYKSLASLEKYNQTQLESLQEALAKYHPF